MTLKRATPMPPMAYFIAKLAMCAAVRRRDRRLLSFLGATFGGVRPGARPVGAALARSLIAGAVPFCALGLAIGYFAGPNSAPPLVNLLYLPTSFASGLWIPIEMLPPVVQTIAPYLPPYHLAQLALAGDRRRAGRAGLDARRLAGRIHARSVWAWRLDRLTDVTKTRRGVRMLMHAMKRANDCLAFA